MKVAITHLAAAMAGVAMTLAISHSRPPYVDKTFAFRLKEPALIASPRGQQRYLMPAGTVVYHQYSLEEGPGIYVIEAMFDGQLSMERLARIERGDPLKLFALESRDITELLGDYPLSKEDLARILHARRITRAELEQMRLK